jgi:hypothetical protein
MIELKNCSLIAKQQSLTDPITQKVSKKFKVAGTTSS